MKIKQWFEQDITIKYYELKIIIILTLLSTLFLLNIWPRFRNDAIEFSWYLYLILIIIILLTWILWKKYGSNKDNR